MKQTTITILTLALLERAIAISRLGIVPESNHRPHPTADVGDKLFLTPYIEAGKFDEAKAAALVGPLPNAPDVKSYAGFLTVNKQFDSNLWFWFFPNANQSAPILVWLQGGPGGSSLFGLFVENGPYVVNDDSGGATLRDYSWTRDFHVIYFDNPVGTGYSFTNDSRGYAQNETDVARDMFEALQQFFELFNEYQHNEFYLTGESYAGKYVPAIGYKIANESATAKMNLTGVILGNALIDPETQINYASLLYEVGLIDEKENLFLRDQQQKILNSIQVGDTLTAGHIFSALLLGGYYNYNQSSWLTNTTGQINHYHYLKSQLPPDYDYYNKYVITDQFRKAIHVGNQTYDNGGLVAENLEADLMRSTKDYLIFLMEKYRVLLYSGNLDIIVACPLTENMLSLLKWPGADAWAMADKAIWKLNEKDSDVTGYIRQVNQFYYFVVRNAGHIVPNDQPAAAYSMVYSFLKRLI